MDEPKVTVWKRITPGEPKWAKEKPADPLNWERAEVTKTEWTRLQPSRSRTEDE